MNFLNELFSNNSFYLTLSKEMKQTDLMYNKFISNNVFKINKIRYNFLLSELIKELEELEDYEKCQELNKMFIDIPENYKEPKCSFDINVFLEHKGLDLVPEEELLNMTDDECVIKLFQVIQGDSYKPLPSSVVTFISFIFKNGNIFGLY